MENKVIDLKPLILLEQFTVKESGLSEVPKGIRHVSSTINTLDLSKNCIKTLENMENIVFRKLARIYLMENRIYHLNHMSLHLPALLYFALYENHLTHLDDMSTCQWGLANEGSGFVTVELYFNPWHCNGSMHWLQSSLCKSSKHMSVYYIRPPQGLIIGISRLICDSPMGFQGQTLVALDELNLNKLEVCSKGEYYLMVCLSFALYESSDNF